MNQCAICGDNGEQPHMCGGSRGLSNLQRQTHPQTCGICGQTLNTTVCQLCAQKEAARAWDERKHYRDECMELRIKNAALVKILKALEWVQDEEIGAYWCPACFAQKCEGHLKDCALGVALQDSADLGEKNNAR